jgi:transcriptional regulator with XRE-family HTH domain
VNQLKHIRVAVLDMTQAAFADLVGVSQATISRWEQGEGSPTLDHLQLIRAEFFRRRIPWREASLFNAAQPSPRRAPASSQKRSAA